MSLAKLDVAEWCEKVEDRRRGFPQFPPQPGRAGADAAIRRARRASFLRENRPRRGTVVIDFSSPNVAKPMHVGHIRSTILGDSLARTLRLLGHRVVTDNHIGDWGTQFGKLIVGWKTGLDRAALQADPIAEMERLYKSVNAAGEADPAVLEQARQELVKLQAGDAENLAIWREMIALSEEQFDTIYGRLGVKFDHTYGESFYNPRLKGVVQELREQGHCPRERRRDCRFLRRSLPPKQDPFLKQEDGEWKPNPFLDPKKRRRGQLRHHRPRDARVPARNLASGRDCLCDRRPAAASFPAACSPRSAAGIRRRK